MLLSNVLLPVLGLVCSTALASLQVHDDAFVPDAVLRVTAANVSVGGIERYTVLVNGTAPGPPLSFEGNGAVWIRVYNDISNDNLTMHWHGLSQAAYPFSDGTPLASQWPIPPMHYFDYALDIKEDMAGTYFYHSHVGFQAVSANGPLIIKEKKAQKPYPTDGEKTVLLSELFNKTDNAIEAGLTSNPFVWSGEANAILVNGKGISPNATEGSPSIKLDQINVEPAKQYRVRFIGAQALSLLVLGIEGHKGLQVIEADGSYTKPQSTDILQMGSGQRYSVLLKTKSCDELAKEGKLDYYMQIEVRERPADTKAYAIVHYQNTCGIPKAKENRVPNNSFPAKAPLTLPPTVNGFLDYQLRPLKANGFPSASEVTRRVTIKTQQLSDKYIIWQDSNVTWTAEAPNNSLPEVTAQFPYLVALYENATKYLPSYDAATANGGVDPNTQTFPARIGEVLEIVLQNVGGVPNGSLDVHPWHAHGEHYYDLGGGNGTYDAAANEAKLAAMGGDTPVRRDSTMLYRYGPTTKAGQDQGWRAWRLRVQQPGVWMVHCHTLQHMLMGMQTVWVFGEEKDILTVPYPDVTGYLTYGGDVYGNDTHYPKVVHMDSQ